MERDQLVIQLEKSQDMLMNFQQELNHSEAELEKHKQEVNRLKTEQKRMSQDVEKGGWHQFIIISRNIRVLLGTKEVLENRDREIANLRQQLQQAQKERDTHKQRAEKAEKMVHESGTRGDAELEQWRKVIEQETKRADQAEKTSQDLQKRIQVNRTE